MVSSKLALVLMLTAGGVMGRNSDSTRRLDRLNRRNGPSGGFGAGGTDPLTHPAAPDGGSGGYGNGGTDPLTHPADGSSKTPVSAVSGGQMHWSTDASGMTGAELQKHLPSGFFLGSAIDNPDLKDPKDAPLAQYLPYMTPGNSLKMQFVYENENSWQELLKGVTEATKSSHIKWKYHTVIWGAEQSQKMMQQSFSKEAMMKTITDFVTNKLCSKIIKEADFWGIDVLNEVFDDSGKGFKKNGYFEVIGEEGYKQVLKLVKRQCPSVKIIVNDYGMESMNPKSAFAFKTIKQWLAEGVPVDVVGLQFHVGLDNKYEDMLASIKRWTDESIPVVLSEVDVPINLPPSKEDLEKQAQQYGNIVHAALEGGAFGCSFWGLKDDHTWFGTQQNPGVGKGKVGAPLIFDAEGKPKAAVAAIVDVFKKWGSKPAGIQNGRASDLTKGLGGSSGSSMGGAEVGTGTDAGVGGTGSEAGAGSGTLPGTGAAQSGSPAEGYGSAPGVGSGSDSDSSSSGSGIGAPGHGSVDKGPADMGPGGAGTGASPHWSTPGSTPGSIPGSAPGSIPGSTGGSTPGSADGSAGSTPGNIPGGPSGDSQAAPGEVSPAPKKHHHKHHGHHGHHHSHLTPDFGGQPRFDEPYPGSNPGMPGGPEGYSPIQLQRRAVMDRVRRR